MAKPTSPQAEPGRSPEKRTNSTSSSACMSQGIVLSKMLANSYIWTRSPGRRHHEARLCPCSRNTLRPNELTRDQNYNDTLFNELRGCHSKNTL